MQTNIETAPGYWCDAIYSPDDGGWYLHEVCGGRSQVSRKVYQTADEARAEYEADTVVWTQ